MRKYGGRILVLGNSAPAAAFRPNRSGAGTAQAQHRTAQKYGKVYAGLPDDLINFHHDPLACAIALGWLTETPDLDGIPVRLVTKIDAVAFNAFWVTVVGG